MSEWQRQLALLPEYLGQHLLLTLAALGIGLLLSLPLAAWLHSRPRWQGPVLMLASAVQTIPALALLALMVPLLDQIGFLPALLALVLYSVLPIVRNAVTGLAGVDPNAVEAAHALGMTPRQVLLKVQLPLALPVIVAGIRTATVWVVGIATLSTPVGATSLGNYIFVGLQTQNTVAVLMGSLAAAGLALLLDGLIRLLETGLTPTQPRRRLRLASAVLGLLLICLAPLWMNAMQATPQMRLVIGSKNFTEQYILADLLETRLARHGIASQRLDSLGSNVIFEALASGHIDLYIDYSGTLWANQMKRQDNPGRQAVLQELQHWLADAHGIDTAIPLGFENAYALALPRAVAEAEGISTIRQLKVLAQQWRIGGDFEFFQRPEWLRVEQLYGLNFAAVRSMDPSLMYPAVDSGEVEVIAAFSTDGRIDAFDLQVLDDPQQALPPYDALLLIGPSALAKAPQLAQVLAPLRNSISNARMRAANRQVDVDGEPIERAANALLEAISRAETDPGSL